MEGDFEGMFPKIIDLDNYVSIDEKIKEWNSKVKRRLHSLFDIECITGLENIMKWYIQTLIDDFLNTEINFNFLLFMKRHLHCIYSCFKALNCISAEGYLEKMETMLAFYYDAERKIFIREKRKRKTIIKQMQRVLLTTLNTYLLNYNERVYHVLMKMKLNITINEGKTYLENIFRIVFSKEPKNISDAGFCCVFILIQKWKKLNSIDTWKNFDKILETKYVKQLATLSSNRVWREISSNKSSFLETLTQLEEDDTSLIHAYFNFIKSQNNEGDIDNEKTSFYCDNIHEFDIDSNDDNSKDEFYLLMKNCAKSTEKDNIQVNVKVEKESDDDDDEENDCILNSENLRVNPAEFQFEISDEEELFNKTTKKEDIDSNDDNLKDEFYLLMKNCAKSTEKDNIQVNVKVEKESDDDDDEENDCILNSENLRVNPAEFQFEISDEEELFNKTTKKEDIDSNDDNSKDEFYLLMKNCAKSTEKDNIQVNVKVEKESDDDDDEENDCILNSENLRVNPAEFQFEISDEEELFNKTTKKESSKYSSSKSYGSSSDRYERIRDSPNGNYRSDSPDSQSPRDRDRSYQSKSSYLQKIREKERENRDYKMSRDKYSGYKKLKMSGLNQGFALRRVPLSKDCVALISTTVYSNFKYKMLQPYFEDNFCGEVAKSMAIQYLSKVTSVEKKHREIPAFVATTRSYIIYLHDYNMKVHKVSSVYPYTEEFSNLILHYVLLECRILYKRLYFSKDKELQVEDRILRLLLNIYNDYFSSKMSRGREVLMKSSMAIFDIFKKLRFNIPGANYRLLENMTIVLLKKIGLYEKVKAYKENQIPGKQDDPYLKIFSTDVFKKDETPDTLNDSLELFSENQNQDPNSRTEPRERTLSDILKDCTNDEDIIEVEEDTTQIKNDPDKPYNENRNTTAPKRKMVRTILLDDSDDDVELMDEDTTFGLSEIDEFLDGGKSYIYNIDSDSESDTKEDFDFKIIEENTNCSPFTNSSKNNKDTSKQHIENCDPEKVNCVETVEVLTINEDGEANENVDLKVESNIAKLETKKKILNSSNKTDARESSLDLETNLESVVNKPIKDNHINE